MNRFAWRADGIRPYNFFEGTASRLLLSANIEMLPENLSEFQEILNFHSYTVTLTQLLNQAYNSQVNP
jgi:hypothetical protein